jgi:hypothetical protein
MPDRAVAPMALVDEFFLDLLVNPGKPFLGPLGTIMA